MTTSEKNSSFRNKEVVNAPINTWADWITIWADGSVSAIDEKFESLRELILREQFLFSCTRELAAFLREQAPTDMESMMNMAARFAVAHPTVVSRDSRRRRLCLDEVRFLLPLARYRLGK